MPGVLQAKSILIHLYGTKGVRTDENVTGCISGAGSHCSANALGFLVKFRRCCRTAKCLQLTLASRS
jgi:hypothetical protein